MREGRDGEREECELECERREVGEQRGAEKEKKTYKRESQKERETEGVRQRVRNNT